MNRFVSRLGAAGSLRSVPTHSVRASTRWLQSRHNHQRIPLPYNVEEGMGNFLPPSSLKMVAVDYQQGLLDRLNDEVKDTVLQNKSVAQTVIEAALDPSKVLAYNYASEALNNSFFLQCLKPPATGFDSNEHEMDLWFSQKVKHHFGSLEQLKSNFSSTALGMFGPGWVWLVCDETANLAVYPTFGTGTLLIRSKKDVYEDKKIPIPVIGSEPPYIAPTTPHDLNPKPTSPASGLSHRPNPLHPSTPSRLFSSSSAPLSPLSVTAKSLDNAGVPSAEGYVPPSKIGRTLFPLLCVSVHEHAWLSAGYGVWGKEEYMKRFWSVVDWKQVSAHFKKFAPSTRGRA